ncbi:glucose-6-phosphate dehydrogenase [Halobacillus locisalis]|uniref:Glucose-6-phosphate 1-dehydrogenase n=1 Tax=Halobacillus locisalis TaxID=220753 RepID=A0A838CTM5_9BACI|nr:glucose-6-phosphate dehydrogenase [Halobacillus locisalis]MBA2175340.1 glucose-6-phosphate dehydrogenase [Halobacillus locisalis]
MEDMTFVLFGATGDLAKRKIYPALYNLYVEGKMPESISVIGLGRTELTNEDLQAQVEEALNEFSRRDVQSENIQEFLSKFRYFIFDAMKEESYDRLRKYIEDRESELGIPDNRLFYLSVAPRLVEMITTQLDKSGVSRTNGWRRLIVEKPFGSDLESARELNACLKQVFDEEEIYRIDHYLGKPMVQNLESLIRPNPILKALWDHDQIANVQITASETVGVGSRASYYDKAGAIKDMVQNHLLQLVMMTAVHHEKKLSPKQTEEKKREIMESLQPVEPENLSTHVIRGQYEEGELSGEAVPAYRDESGVTEGSNNDTFFAAKLCIDNEYWRGIPFYIRTGKRMNEKSTRIVIEFKKDTDDAGIVSNLLVIQVNPDESISLRVNMKDNSTDQFEPQYISFSDNSSTQPEAYERLLYDGMVGNSTYFAHWHEVELSWEWVQPILDAFEQDEVPLHFYPAGSKGPSASHELLEKDGFEWN